MALEMAILFITFDCTCHGGGWINIATLDGSESVRLSDHDLDHNGTDHLHHLSPFINKII